MSTLTHSETRLRRLLGWTLGATVLGVAASVYHGPGLGAWLSVAGLVGLVLCVHRLGRLGPDPPLRFGKLRTGHEKRRSG
ncbi:MAG: hypothetical protein JW940_19560 [Polyangiaceae bacterium]|nr:hypothetical protein [Polyangiaceae bacterium]